MLKILKWFFGLFSPYVNSFERKVDKFFKRIKSTDNIHTIKKQLLELMNGNLIVTNVWMEKKYKGYTYLDKKTRRKMYEDVQSIIKKFEEHNLKFNPSIDAIKKQLEAKNLLFPNGDEDKIKYIVQIMAFLRPGLYYNYIKTASFGKLLRDPNSAKLEGDCNQIVTLYIYFYSLKFPIDDLRIKLLPEHVCLHFRDIDIEATNGTFQKYEKCREVLPVTEIISTNLLDLADFREETQKISPRVMVKSAQLAYAISSLRSLVVKNLNVAYKNLGISAMRANDFETAIFYFGKAGDQKVLQSAYHNGAVYYMGQNNFEKAKYYAGKEPKLLESVKHNEGIYYYKQGRINDALEIFQLLGDEKMKKACYAKQYNDLVKQLSTVRTVADQKRYKHVYQKMAVLAEKMGDSGAAYRLRETLSKI